MADAKVNALKQEAEALQNKRRDVQASAADTNLAQTCGDLPDTGRVVMRQARNLKGHLSKIYSMHWANDSRHIVSASQDGKLIVWDAYTTNKVHAIPLTSSWVMTCAYAPSGNYVACGGLDNNCSVYSLTSQQGNFKAHHVLKGHTGYLSCCRFVSDDTMITSSGDSTCGVWDINQEVCKSRLEGHTADVMSIAVNESNPNLFVSASCDHVAKVWDVRSGKSVQSFFGHTGDINSVAWFPNYQSFGTGSDDGSVKIFDMRSDNEVANLALSDEVGITSIAFSKSGRLLFAGYDNNVVRIWDAVKGVDVGILDGHQSRVACLGVSKDGLALCTGSWDATLKIWN